MKKEGKRSTFTSVSHSYRETGRLSEDRKTNVAFSSHLTSNPLLQRTGDRLVLVDPKRRRTTGLIVQLRVSAVVQCYVDMIKRQTGVSTSASSSFLGCTSEILRV